MSNWVKSLTSMHFAKKRTSKSMSRVTIYTDGACAGNPGPGGWGALLIFKDKKKEIFGYDNSTTNNRMEMQAAILALKELKTSCYVDLYTDSKYLMQGITEWIHNWQKNGWKTKNKKPVKNADLWQALQVELARHHQVNWNWVKGHASTEGNIIADSLAVRGKEQAIRNIG